MGGVKVLEAEDADMARIFEITSLAFQRNEPFWDLLYPNHWTPEGRQIGAERMVNTKHSDPHTTYLKAVDEDTGIIMGMAKWNIYDHRMPEDVAKDQQKQPPLGDYWESDDEKAYAVHMMKVYVDDRMDAVRKAEGNLVSLDILTIDPAYQRRGVGGKLVQWGTSKADAMGVGAVVESSVYGKGLYEKNGFVFVKNGKIEAPEKYPGRPVYEYAWLVRPKKQ